MHADEQMSRGVDAAGQDEHQRSTHACVGWAQHLALLQPRQAVQQRQLQPLRQARAEPLQGETGREEGRQAGR
jgi:hypothetical protein